MVTYEQDGARLSFYGLSTDDKPTTVEYVKGNTLKVPNGSTLYEMDSKKVFMFNEASSTWVEQ